MIEMAVRVALVALLLIGSISCAVFGAMLYNTNTVISVGLFVMALYGTIDAIISWILLGASDD